VDIVELLKDNWIPIATAVAGMVVCTLGGLLAVSVDRERPALFAPLYAAALLLFLGGLGMITYCDILWNKVAVFW